jgi:hypothetical protein
LKLTRPLALALALGASVAKAQMYSPAYGANGAPMSNFLANSYLAQQLANKALTSAHPQKARKMAASSAQTATAVFRETTGPIAPKKLAQSYPLSAQAEVERSFAQILDGYRAIESRFGLKRNDLSGAVAAFIAGNYTALRDEPFPDKNFRPLVRQIRSAIDGLAPLRSASDHDKQELYENLAIVGAYMALTREALVKNPNSKLTQDIQAAARNYLREFLHIDPMRLKITPQGMILS